MEWLNDSFVLIKGAGDLATGVAVRLHRCGFPVIMTELREPLVVRRTVSFAEAVYQGQVEVEGIRAVRVATAADACAAVAQGKVPVLVDPLTCCRAELRPDVLVDAIIAKANTGTRLDDAPLVIALGPGFVAGQDCHVVIETNRGHWLGRPLYEGSAEPDTGVPGTVGGYSVERVLRAPVAGTITTLAAIGDPVVAGQLLATVDGRPVPARLSGVLRGLIRSGVRVTPGLKVGDVDPSGDVTRCYSISEKAFAIAGGVLEAILVAHQQAGDAVPLTAPRACANM